MKKIQLIIAFISIICSIELALAQQLDKSAATMDIIQGFTDEFDSVERNKKYFSPNLTIYWPGGGSSNLDQFWKNNYSQVKKNAKHEVFDVVIRELDNETFAFFEWQTTIRKNDQNPELVGTVARVPIAYRMVWDNGKIKQWHLYWDNEYLKAQRGVD